MADIPKSPFTVNMAHVVRGREYPPVDWLITDLFAKGDQILLAGATGLGKSLVSLLLAISAVTGRQFANLPIEPIKMDNQINAFYLDAEMPESVIAERLQRTHISDKEEVFLKNLFITNQVEQDYRFDLTDEESQNHLLNFTNLFGVDLAIVDNIFSVMSLKSFNDPEEYIKHLRPLLFNFRRHKTTGLFVDHLNRSEELYGNITKQIHFDTIIRLTKDVDGIYELEFKKNRRIGLYDKPITFRIDQSTNIVSYVSKDGKGDIETYMRNNYEKIRSSAPSASVAIDRLVESAKRVNDEWQITEEMIKTWKHNPKRYFE
tara:strand:+ start:382 stop:1335 length:954 start_codon:yes stop_codon:yes gene_type:complete